MTLKAGAEIWIPCSVSRGPFPDERTVVARSEDGDWSGFVDERWLESGGENSEDQVLAIVTDDEDTTFMARIPGHPLRHSLFRGRTERVVRRGAVRA